MSSPEPIYAGEVMLLRWSESSANGMTVTLTLDSGPDGYSVHPFRGYETGKDAARFYAVLVPMEPSEPSQQAHAPQRASQAAALLCQSARFMRWLGVGSAADARQRVCSRCGIESRRELDSNEEAAAEWQKMMGEYVRWSS